MPLTQRPQLERNKTTSFYQLAKLKCNYIALGHLLGTLLRGTLASISSMRRLLARKAVGFLQMAEGARGTREDEEEQVQPNTWMGFPVNIPG